MADTGFLAGIGPGLVDLFSRRPADLRPLMWKLLRKIWGLSIFSAGIFCYALGVFILAAFLPKILAVYREVYHGDLGILFLKGDWGVLLLMVVLPVTGTPVVLFALGYALLKRNYVCVLMIRRFRQARMWLMAEISYRKEGLKDALLRPLLVREILYALALASVLFGMYQHFPALLDLLWPNR